MQLPDLEAISALLQPENALETALIGHTDIAKGLWWGEPRFGHPEGKVYLHVREIYDNIDQLNVSAEERYFLRLIALTHDSFKYCEDKNIPRDWLKHHGAFARRFMENYIDDRATLDIIELHDEAYYCWRMMHKEQRLIAGNQRLETLLEKVGYCLQRYYLFFKCDTRTGDKIQTPVKWFERTIEGIELVVLR